MKKRKRRKRTKRITVGSVLSTVILIVSFAVFVFAAYKLYLIFHEYNKGDNSYEKVREYIRDTEADADDMDDFYVDFDSLLKQNSDLIAWIRIDGTINISYPVMQSEDNDFYLRRLFDKSHNILGSIFMDFNCSSDLTDENTIIYGHNTKNGSMFGGLKKWKEKDEYDDNPYFYIYTPDGMSHQYQVCSVTITDAESLDYQIGFEDTEEFLEWESEILGKSLYDTGVELDENSKIVTLSTCTNRTAEERLVVHGVEIKTRECAK